jgi:Domain of unknown function (DUF4396)
MDHHPAHDHPAHGPVHGGSRADGGGRTSMAASATLHCLTGCAIGEIAGLIIGTALELPAASTIALSIGLAFVFGYTLSTLPLLRSGLAVTTALSVVLAADTLSILVMEVVDNAVMAAVPGAMDAGLTRPLFWASLALALVVAFGAALPVNRYLLARGKGHALTHQYRQGDSSPVGLRRYIPDLPSSLLVTAITAFLAGALLVSIAASAS